MSLYQNIMSKSRGKKGKGNQIPLFISKLVQMVENREIEATIAWTSMGDSFNIKNITKFTEEVLPRYFKHRNFSSFIRQLNMYGFRKIRHCEGQNVYMHQNFKMGGKQLLKNINRKIREEKQEGLSLYPGGAIKPDLSNGKQIQDLKIKQKNLEQMCRGFFLQNQKLMQDNQNLIKKMEQQSRQKQKRLQDFLILLLAQNTAKSITSENEPQLSISNEQFMGNSLGQTPLESLGNVFEQNGHMKRVKNLIETIYGPNFQKRSNNNFTIVSPKRQEQAMGEPQMKNDSQYFNQQENSFLSINDFINADEYENEINLDQSR